MSDSVSGMSDSASSIADSVIGSVKSLDSAACFLEQCEIISQITAELFCNRTLEPLYLAALRDDSHGADKLYDNLRYDLKSLGCFLKPRDRNLVRFAEALQDETIANGIARAAVAYARWCVCMEKMLQVPCPHQQSGHGNGSTIGEECTCLADFVFPTFELDSTSVQEIMDCGAYAKLTPERVWEFVKSRRYRSFVSRVLDQVIESYEQRIGAAIGSTAMGEDGYILKPFDLQKMTEELSCTPPHLISFAEYGDEEANVRWRMSGASPDLVKGFCRLKVTATRGLVRYIDIQEHTVQAVKAAIATAPKINHFYPDQCFPVGELIKRKCNCCVIRR